MTTKQATVYHLYRESGEADFRPGRADFADYLLGWQSLSAGCADTVTFDRKLNGAAGFALLA